MSSDVQSATFITASLFHRLNCISLLDFDCYALLSEHTEIIMGFF